MIYAILLRAQTLRTSLPLIIGDIAFTGSNGESIITSLCVHPHYRKKGIAQHLMILGEAYLEFAHNSRIIKLQVRVNNYGAITIYEKGGDHITKLLKEYYGDSDGYLMMKTSPSILLSDVIEAPNVSYVQTPLACTS